MAWILAALGVLVGAPLLLSTLEIWRLAAASPLAWWFAGGIGGGVVTALVVQRVVPFLPILEHELTHMLAAICLLRKPLGVRADDEGGDTTYAGRGSTLIRLAPYVVPTVTLLALGLRPIVRDELQQHLAVVLGVTFGFHLVTGFVEAHPRQPDLRKGGLLPSYVAVLTWGPAVHIGVALAALGGWPLVHRWLEGAWYGALTLIR